jgi:regulator of nucleoside diphosphate kinase
MTRSDETPRLLLSTAVRDRLIDLATAALDRMPREAALLLDEADRAAAVPDSELPADVVRMGSYVEFRDEDTGQSHRVQLVYPQDADISKSKISVLTLVGAGLIGLAEGQSMVWPTHRGHGRRITILKVADAPFERAPAHD